MEPLFGRREKGGGRDRLALPTSEGKEKEKEENKTRWGFSRVWRKERKEGSRVMSIFLFVLGGERGKGRGGGPAGRTYANWRGGKKKGVPMGSGGPGRVMRPVEIFHASF